MARGGKREGAGRKAVGTHKIAFVCPDEVFEILQRRRLYKPMSEQIVDALYLYLRNTLPPRK